MKMHSAEVFLAFLVPFYRFFFLNVHISEGSFIGGPECFSSQMSSPAAEWEGKHSMGGWSGGGGLVTEKREMCVRAACVCRGTKEGEVGGRMHKSRLNGAHNCC